MSTASKERQARLYNIVKKLFPKVMQQIFKECVSPRGLQGKYKQKFITIDFTENEISLMEKLPNIDDFTIELCYKILRYENVFHEPLCKWGNVPHDAEVEIGDDVQRILNATNDFISRKSDEISHLYYEEFQKRTQEVLKRVDTYLCQDTSIQLYRKNQSSDINMTDMLQELALMQQIKVVQIVDDDSENIERYSRVSGAITDTFPKILRDIIDSNISARDLYQLCLPHLNGFSSDQQTILHGANSSNSYESMDITLIYKLLRQFSLISSPTRGWGNYPDKVDVNLADDVERIRRYRNHLAHRCNTKIGKDEFDDYFDKFRHIGYRMDLNFFNKTNYKRLIVVHQTCSMDKQMQTKYMNALKQLENIKLQFEKKPIKFFWGESFNQSLRNLRSILKEEKSKEEKRKVRVQIIFQNTEDVEKTIDILNSLRNEINKDLNGIEFIVATKGSIVLNIDVLPQMLETDELLQLTLNSFLRKVLERITTSNTESIDIVVLPLEEFTQGKASKTNGRPVYLDFDIEAESFETDDKMEEELNKILKAISKHSNSNDITASILPICRENLSTREGAYTLTETSEGNVSNTEEAFSQAQTPVKYTLPVSVNLFHQFSIKTDRNKSVAIANCIKIGTTLVFSDCIKNQIVICNSEGTDIHHFPLPNKPYSIIEIDSDTMAASCVHDKLIMIIHISTRSVINKIYNIGYCYGISYYDNNLYAVIDQSKIHVISLTGKIIRAIPLPSNIIHNITVDRNRLVCIDYTSIYCCSLDGKLIWKFTNEKYQDFRRVTTDNERNVYVTSPFTKTVVVVSHDGEHYKELLTTLDGLQRPDAIYFDKKENILLVCNYFDDQAFLFNVNKNLLK